jgi:hypothetical protein
MASRRPERRDGPLDGSVSGTIGGGGPESGGPTRRKRPADPPVKIENAASGRLEPDPLATVERDDLPGPRTDVSNAAAPPRKRR